MTTRKSSKVDRKVEDPAEITRATKIQSVRKSTRGEKGGRSKAQADQPPVPPEKHYDVFKTVESRIKDRLGNLQHPYYFTGLRVAYDLKDSSNEPYELPHSFEFGDLSVLDLYIKCGEQQKLTEDDFREITENAPIQYDFLKVLYEDTRAELQGATNEDLRVGVYIVLNGSKEQDYAMTCSCGNQRNKRFVSVPNRNSNQSTSGARNQRSSSQAQSCGQVCTQPARTTRTQQRIR
jgi:hypothetical protein